MMKIKTGDNVIVLTGKDKGKTGTVTAVYPKLQKVLIDGINITTRHKKPSQQLPQGGVVKESQPIDISKVGIAHPSKKGQASRVGFDVNGKNKKRVYRQAGNKEVK